MEIISKAYGMDVVDKGAIFSYQKGSVHCHVPMAGDRLIILDLKDVVLHVDLYGDITEDFGSSDAQDLADKIMVHMAVGAPPSGLPYTPILNLVGTSGMIASWGISLTWDQYSGALAKYRRTVDDQMKIFYPNAEGWIDEDSINEDTDTLLDWMGSSDVKCVELYDHTGLGLIAASNGSTEQPSVATAGVLHRDANGNPEIRPDSTSSMKVDTPGSLSQPFMVVQIGSCPVAVDAGGLIQGDSSPSNGLLVHANEVIRGKMGNNFDSDSISGLEYILGWLSDGATSKNAINDENEKTGDGGTDDLLGTTSWHIVKATNAPWQQMTIWGADHWSSWDTIKAAENTHYGGKY